VSQHDYLIDNQNGASFRSDLNNALAAIVTQNAGVTAPSSTFARQLWADTSSSVLKIRNSTNTGWEVLGSFASDPFRVYIPTNRYLARYAAGSGAITEASISALGMALIAATTATDVMSVAGIVYPIAKITAVGSHVTVTNTDQEVTIFSTSLPANTLNGRGVSYKMFGWYRTEADSSSMRVRVKLGSTTVSYIETPVNHKGQYKPWQLDSYIYSTNSSGGQFAFTELTYTHSNAYGLSPQSTTGGTLMSAHRSIAENAAGSLTFAVTIQPNLQGTNVEAAVDNQYLQWT